ncbi:hypothetical protein [Paenibacillus tyrfis]|uniref:Uncharacterized protein n=1 Tax=Paenibacillus tyrfis TaxID=1501230 RepID=A0A081PAQ7_9BACL|nr:hypothetical protein [Paenibacillus tyrfis]KEQ27780.1 hypothetical protein ET33_13990 [Paenibacillus tyrfis]
MKKLVVYGLLALSLTVGIVTTPLDTSTANAQTTGNGQRVTGLNQVQPAASDTISFKDDYVERGRWIRRTDAKITITTPKQYRLQVTQNSLDGTTISNVGYDLINENDFRGSRSFNIPGNGKSKEKYIPLLPGTYHVEYFSQHNSPIKLDVFLYPEA